MSKVLVAYESRTGNTGKMADFIAEGVRMGGHEVIVKKLSELKKDEDLQGYDGYVLGCPTYHRDMTQGMKQFLFRMQGAGLGEDSGMRARDQYRECIRRFGGSSETSWPLVGRKGRRIAAGCGSIWAA